MTQNPCAQTCPNRSATCHGKCQKYTAWKQQNDAERDARWLASRLGYTEIIYRKPPTGSTRAHIVHSGCRYEGRTS